MSQLFCYNRKNRLLFCVEGKQTSALLSDLVRLECTITSILSLCPKKNLNCYIDGAILYGLLWYWIRLFRGFHHENSSYFSFNLTVVIICKLYIIVLLTVNKEEGDYFNTWVWAIEVIGWKPSTTYLFWVVNCSVVQRWYSCFRENSLGSKSGLVQTSLSLIRVLSLWNERFSLIAHWIALIYS